MWYRSGSGYQDTLLILPGKLDCGIPAADGLDNRFQIDIYASLPGPNAELGNRIANTVVCLAVAG
jgi:hypothetical protein